MKIHVLVVIAILCSGSFVFGQPASTTQQNRKPNILFISIDDLRPELGYCGNTQIKTPNFDALAGHASVMLEAHCQVAVCAPSRASVMLGYRPDSTRVWHLGDSFRKINPGAVTMPQYFHNAGYYTVNIGKIFHNFMPDSVSWDEPDLKPYPYNTEAYRYRDAETYWYSPRSLEIQETRRNEALQKVNDPHKLYADGWNMGPAFENIDLPDTAFYDGKQVSLALTTIQRIKNKDEPFFMGLGLYRPHLPFVAPTKYWDMYPPGSVSPPVNPNLPKNVPVMSANSNYELKAYYNPINITRPEDPALPAAYQDSLRRGYYASVSYIDAQLGRLIAGLKKMGLYENTIIVIWGDHGWKLGDMNGWGKQTNFYVDTHVPLLIKAADQQKGQRINAMTELVDIFPTLCDLSGITKAGYLQGSSMVPLFANPTRTWKKAVFSQFRRRPHISKDGQEYMGYSMLTKEYHYIEWYHWDNTTKTRGEYAATELYDHIYDFYEKINIAGEAEKQELVKKLSAQLQAGWKAAVPKQ